MNPSHFDPGERYRALRRLAFADPSPSDPPIGIDTQGTEYDVRARLSSAKSSYEKWVLLRELAQRGHSALSSQAVEVLVVICEFTLAGTPATFVAHEDGNASMYLGTGGGVVGGVGHRNVRTAASALCAAIANSLVSLQLIREHPPLPADGEFVVTALTNQGMLSQRVPETSARDRGHPLHDVYLAMHDLIGQLRLVESGKSTPTTEDGAAYANCLLTLMAENGTGDAAITSGATLPDLTAMARTADQRAWVNDEGLANVDTIDSAYVIKLLAGRSRIGWLRKKGVMVTKLANSDGTATDFTFKIELSKDLSGRKTLRITL